MSNLWWFHTSADRCSFNELQRRKALAFGWTELGDISRILKDKPGWERQFKTYLQVKGDMVFHGDNKWRDGDRNLDSVPSIVWQFFQIQQGDLVAVIETGNQLTLGRPEVRGIGQIQQNAMTSYRFESDQNHGHCIGGSVNWMEWDSAHMGELPLPKTSFRVICQDNEGLEIAENAIRQGVLA